MWDLPRRRSIKRLGRYRCRVDQVIIAHQADPAPAEVPAQNRREWLLDGLALSIRLRVLGITGRLHTFETIRDNRGVDLPSPTGTRRHHWGGWRSGRRGYTPGTRDAAGWR